MARQIDTSSLQGFKTLRDVNAQNTLVDQKINAGNVANAQAANINATQMLSAAAASGDQNIYTQTKQRLAAMGTDMSGWADDIATGAKQAEAARLAQSPIGALLNAGLKAETNGIAAATAMGDVGKGAAITPLSQTLMGGLSGILPGMGGGAAVVPRQRPAQVLAQPAPPALPAAMPGQDPEAEFQTRLQESQAQNGVSPAQDPALAAKAPGGFVPPKQNPGETNQAYMQRANLAFEQWKSNPETLRTQTTATGAGKGTGEEIAQAAKTVNVMQANLPIVLQRFADMRQAAQDASSGIGIDTEGNGWKTDMQKTGVGSQTVADANAVLRQRAAQGILPELGPQLAQAGVKGNRFLETIANSASGLELDAPPETKIKLIDGLQLQYVNNLKSSADQLRKNGQPAPTDAEIDAAVAKYAPAVKTSQPSASPYKVGQMIDGTDGKYVYMGGDATSPQSYKKVQ